METPQHHGAAPPFDLAPSKSFSQANGYNAEYAKKILTETEDAEISALAAQGFDVRTEKQDGTPYSIIRWTVVEPSGGGGTNPEYIITDLWELQDNMLERDYWLLPGVQQQFDLLTGDDKFEKAAYVRRLVEDKVAGKTKTLDLAGDEVPITPSSEFIDRFTELSLNPLIFTNLCNSFSRGGQARLVPQPVVRRTRLLPPYTSIQPLQTQAGKVMSREFLISFEAPPVNIKFALLPGYYFVRSPNMVQQSDNNWQLRQEWWWTESFDNFVYTFIG